MIPITFSVDGLPKGQPRARAFAFKGENGKMKARMYEKGTAEGWKQAVVAAGDKVKPAAPLVGSLGLSILFYMPRPKRLCTRTHPQGELPCIAKPDADNLEKAVMDAMTVAGWWLDDAQISDLRGLKRYPAVGARTGAVVTVWRDEVKP